MPLTLLNQCSVKQLVFMGFCLGRCGSLLSEVWCGRDKDEKLFQRAGSSSSLFQPRGLHTCQGSQMWWLKLYNYWPCLNHPSLSKDFFILLKSAWNINRTAMLGVSIPTSLCALSQILPGLSKEFISISLTTYFKNWVRNGSGIKQQPQFSP